MGVIPHSPILYTLTYNAGDSMGNTKLRRLISQEQKWVDKSTLKHRHRYCIQTLVQLRHADTGWYTYHNVMKCNRCNSFKSIPSPGAIDGFISDNSKIDLTLPVIKLYTSHKHILGWKDAQLDK